jgi:hypothetical protein
MPTVISIEASADKVAQGISKDAAIKALKCAVEKALKAAKVDIDPNAKQGYDLKAKIVSLTTDTKAKPPTMEVTIAISLSHIGGATKLIKASNSGTKEGFDLKKLDAAAAGLIDDVVSAQLDKNGKVVKAM